MTNEEKIRELARKHQGTMTDAQYLQLVYALEEMAQWKDEQLESKLMQIIIFAQQGYTSGATDEMILKHCKEIINENYERNTTKTD